MAEDENLNIDVEIIADVTPDKEEEVHYMLEKEEKMCYGQLCEFKATEWRIHLEQDAHRVNLHCKGPYWRQGNSNRRKYTRNGTLAHWACKKGVRSTGAVWFRKDELNHLCVYQNNLSPMKVNNTYNLRHMDEFIVSPGDAQYLIFLHVKTGYT